MSKNKNIVDEFIQIFLTESAKINKETTDETHLTNVGLKSKVLISKIINHNYLTGMNGNIVTVKYKDVRIVIHCDV